MTCAEVARPRVGISSCLLGAAVRFDGNHKRNGYICDVLGQWFEWADFCPETAIGLGVPREPIHLRRIDGNIRVVGVRRHECDVTDALVEQGRRFLRQHGALDGYILKKDSPSCGMDRVKVYDADGVACTRDGRGVFAAELHLMHPHLPVEEEGRLGDPRLRENFIQRVFVHWRWRTLMNAGDISPGTLIEFHTAHKLLLLAHDPEAYRTLGQRIACAGSEPIASLARDYFAALMAALTTPASTGRHVNVLQHIAGYFRDDLDAQDRAELAELIEAFRLELVPLIVPITLINHHLRRHPKPYIQGQVYLGPYPHELKLRNGA